MMMMQKRADERNKRVIFINCALFTECIRYINGTQTDNAKDTDVVMPVYNLIEYNDNCLKTRGSLWKYYRNEPFDVIVSSKSFTSKIKTTGKTHAAGDTKNVEIAVPIIFRFLSNFWRTLEMPLINCEINLILTWSGKCVFSSATGATKFAITDTKLFVSVVTLSTEDNY